MKGKLWLLAIGLLLGLTAGLFYAWEIDPVQYQDTYPPLMYAPYRADWIRMTTLAHGVQDNLPRTQLRLQGLSQDEVRQGLARTLDEAAAAGYPLAVLHRIATLAAGYGVDTPAVRIYTGEGSVLLRTSTPTATAVAAVEPTPSPAIFIPTPTATPTALPTPLPTPPPSYPYRVISQTSRCLMAPTIAVSITQEITVTVRGRETRQRVGVPGLALWLLSSERADRAFTGLKPEVGLGYADFAIAPEHTYNLYLETPTGIPLASLAVEPCPAPETGWRAWWVEIFYLPPD